MGVAFRYDGNSKHIVLGGRTVKDGEAMAVWNSSGVHTEIIGPQRVLLCSSTIRFLKRHKAEVHQYLRISHRDGRVEHIRGGFSMYQNPTLHDDITVMDAIRLDSESQSIVVYIDSSSESEKIEKFAENLETFPMEKTTIASNITRRIVKGPTIFFPEPDERIHKFPWLSSIADECEVLNLFNLILPTQLQISTSDGFSYGVELLIGYQVYSIEKILSRDDPISEMRKGLLADSLTLGGSVSSQALRDSNEKIAITKKLTELDVYPHFKDAAHNCGLNITSLTITGMSVCDALKKQIVESQELTSTLNSDLKRKTEQRKIRELELEDERKRIEAQAEMEKRKVILSEKLDEESHTIKLAAFERQFELETKRVEAEKIHAEIKDKVVLNFLKDIGDMGVDLTKVLTSTGSKKLLGNRSEALKSIIQE
jgi:hypothetical protein